MRATQVVRRCLAVAAPAKQATRFLSRCGIRAPVTSLQPIHTPLFMISKRHASSLPAGVLALNMPSLSPTMTEGTVANWRRNEGDRVKAGDVLCEIGTDKAKVDFVMEDEGFLAVILVPENTPGVPLGQPLALFAEDEETAKAVKAMNKSAAEWTSLLRGKAPTAPTPLPSSTTPAAQPPASSPASHTSSKVEIPNSVAMPSARILMAEHGINPSVFSGKSTGKAGRITKGDVLAYLSSGAQTAATPAQQAPSVSPSTASSAPAPATTSSSSISAPRAGFTDTKPSQVRRVIAQRLTESKASIPHQYTVMDCQIDSIMKLRNTLKEGGLNLSVNDMIIKAVARALREVPEANCFYDPKSDTVKPNKGVDISVAVATEGGLITPIVKDADKLSLHEINEKVKDLAARARANRLKPEEFQGGSFTISNLGMFGIDEFTAVINPPQACIMAVGKGEKRVVGAPIRSEDELAQPHPDPLVATIMTVSLSSDARVVDNLVAAQFLQVFRHYMQNPSVAFT